jgi:ribosomal protein S18 acetylase RimI-like enzyme
MMSLSFEETQSAYRNQFPDSPFFDSWVPREKFLSAEFDSKGNFAISREDDGIYGIALGSNPTIPSEWKNFSMESRGLAHLPEDFKVVARWDCYWAHTIDGVDQNLSATDSEIDAFLKVHAPQSSVFPGNDEIERWVVIREKGELMAVAALCRWQSGKLVISSVATHTDRRGLGFGKQLMEETLIVGRQLGSDLLCLGVMHLNSAAQRLYASTGFTLMHNFTYCERR